MMAHNQAIIVTYTGFHVLYNTLFSREEIFAKSEFEIVSREDIFAKISSRENIFLRIFSVPQICKLVGLGYAV